MDVGQKSCTCIPCGEDIKIHSRYGVNYEQWTELIETLL